MLIKNIFLHILLFALLNAENEQSTTGNCSPNIINSKGNVTVNCNKKTVAPFFFLDLSCHAYYYINPNPEDAITEFYKFLKNNSGRMVVIEYLISPPKFCASINSEDGMPEKTILQKFKDWDESYASARQDFSYVNKNGKQFRFNISPEDPNFHSYASTLDNDCGHACAHFRLMGISRTTYLSGDGSYIGEIDLAPKGLKFSERYLNTMDEVAKLRKKLSMTMSFSFQ